MNLNDSVFVLCVSMWMDRKANATEYASEVPLKEVARHRQHLSVVF